MNKHNHPVQLRLDIFPETYGSGLTIKELVNIIEEADELKGEDRLLLLSGDCLKTVTLSKLQEAIGGSGGGTDNLHTYATITE